MYDAFLVVCNPRRSTRKRSNRLVSAIQRACDGDLRKTHAPSRLVHHRHRRPEAQASGWVHGMRPAADRNLKATSDDWGRPRSQRWPGIRQPLRACTPPNSHGNSTTPYPALESRQRIMVFIRRGPRRWTRPIAQRRQADSPQGLTQVLANPRRCQSKPNRSGTTQTHAAVATGARFRNGSTQTAVSQILSGIGNRFAQEIPIHSRPADADRDGGSKVPGQITNGFVLTPMRTTTDQVNAGNVGCESDPKWWFTFATPTSSWPDSSWIISGRPQNNGTELCSCRTSRRSNSIGLLLTGKPVFIDVRIHEMNSPA